MLRWSVGAVLACCALAAWAPVANAATLATTFTPVADAYVSSAQTKVNFGTASQLSVSRAADKRTAYLRFNVTGLTAPVSKATLRIWAQAASDAVDVATVSNSNWGETSITNQNSPAIAKAKSGTSGSYAAGQYVDIVITAALTGNGLRSLAVSKVGSLAGPVAFDSREAAHPPQLVVETTDSTAPALTLTSPANNAVTKSPPSIGGAAGASPGDLPSITVTLYAGSTATGTPVQTLTATASAATWSTTPASLGDGTYTVRAEQRDNHANIATSAPRTFSVDSIVPAVTLTTPAAGARIATSTPPLAGAAGNATGDAAQVTVRVYAGGQATGTPVRTIAVTRSGAAWSTTATPALGDGPYTAQAEQSDAAGNVGRSAATTFALDTTAPAVSIDAPSAGASLATADPLISGHGATGSFDVASVSLDIYAGSQALGLPARSLSAAVAGDGTWSLHPGALTDGTWTARARQSDIAGNQGTSVAVTLTIDTVAPAVAVDTPAAGSVIADATPTLAGPAGTAAQDDATVSVALFAGTDTTGTPAQAFTAPVAADRWSATAAPLAGGVYTVRARQQDAAANATTAAATFTVQATAPVVEIVQPADGATLSASTPSISGSAGSATGDATTITITIHAGTDTSAAVVQTLTTQRSGTSWSVTPASLSDGTYTVEAEQDSTAGVGRSAPHTFTIDTALPAYRDVVLADAPAAYWRLGEATGTSAASETSSDTGTYLRETVLGQPGAITGDPNTAVAFDGVNDSFSVPSSSGLNSSGNLTLETWARPTALPATTATLMRKEGQYLVRLSSNGTITFRLWVTTGLKELLTPASMLTVGAWNHVVATSDGTTMAVYVNGAVRATVALTTARLTTTSPLTLASSLTTNDFFNGRIDETAVYSTALSAARVRAHWYASGAPDTTPPAVTIVAPTAGSTTGDATPSIGGAAGDEPDDSATVTLRLYAGATATGTPLETLQATRSGATWSVEPSSALADGTYTAQAEQTDASANVGRSTAVTFQVTQSTYFQDVLADAPRAYWRFGETAGLTASSELSADPGTYLKGVVLGATGAISGDPNTSARFDGINDTVSVPSSARLNLTPQLTLETWVKPDSLVNESTLLRKDGEYLLRVTDDGGVIFRVWVPTAPGGSWNLGTAPIVRSGVWNHIVATRNGASTQIYVNGLLRASGTLYGPAANATSSTLWVGSSVGTNNFVAGLIDETAIYGSVLPAARVRAHFDAAAVTPPTPEVTLDSPAAGSTMDALPTFGGHAEPDLTTTVDVNLYAGTSATGTPIHRIGAVVRPAGTFSVRAPAQLASGTYTATVEQTAGSDVYVSAPKTFSVDTATPPTVLVAGDIAGCETFGDEATALLLDRLPGTVIPNGDLAYEDGSASDIDNCYDPTWGRQKARSRPAVGGHDYRTLEGAPYFDYWGDAAGERNKGYYSYDVGSWHVVTLSTECDEIGGCNAGSPQEQWLRADLAASATSCTLAILPDPRFSSGTIHGSNATYQPLWQALYDHQAELVISGDDHLYERFAPQTPTGVSDPVNGIRQFTVGTGGRSHYPFGSPIANSQVRNNDTFGVLRLSLRAGAYDWEFVPEAGRTFTDTGSMACH